jgi:hypothetical protein
MPIAELSPVERIARVLAGRQFSSNAEGVDPHASHEVDDRWYDFRDDAIAILRTLREPDIVTANAGDADVWRAMVEAAIEDYAGDGEVSTGGTAASPIDVLGDNVLQPPKLGRVTD